MNTPIPVSLITGFLGSGKTTLLNRLLNQGALKDTALIINEFGDVGIDHLLVETADEGIVELADGCLCCTIRGDLVDVFTHLLNRSPRPKRIVIETTGLADPAPILHAIMGHPVLGDHLRLDGVLTVVDAVNGMATLNTHEEAVKQVAVADRLVVTKSDFQEDTDLLIDRLQQLNPGAIVYVNIKHDPGYKELFNCGLYNPETKSADVTRWLNEEAHRKNHAHPHDVNRHDARIQAFSLTHEEPIDATTFATFIDLLRSAHGPNLLRVKGIVKISEHPERPVVVHGVQEVFHPPATLPQWPDNDQRTRMVMITKDLSKEFVQKLFDALTGKVGVDTPDKQAIDENPLLVPGKTF